MYKIQEVVHKFRSGGNDKKDGSGGGGGASRVSVSVPQTAGNLSSGAIQTISTGAVQAGESHGEKMTKWYVDPPQLVSSAPALTEKASLSSLPVITPMGLQQTMLAALGQSDPLIFTASGAVDASSRPTPTSPDKKLAKTQPKGTIEYKVERNDTLEKIAAHFDVTPSELKKLNRMTSRMVFENQVLYIPDPDYVPSDPPTPEHVSPPQSPVDVRPKIDIPIVKMADKPPARVPGHVMKIPSPPPSALPQFQPRVQLLRTLSEDEARKLDEECYERFIKVCAQYICEGFQKVSGTLLVTPNAIMFDPDVLDENVVQKGSDKFGVVVYMDTIMSAALYHDLSAMKYHTCSNSQKESSEKPQIYHGDSRVRSASTSDILTTKSFDVTAGDGVQPFATSKSMSGLSPFEGTRESNKDSTDGSRGCSGLSPFFAEPGESTTDAETLGFESQSGDGESSTIKVVRDALQSDDGRTVDVGGETGETSTDDAVAYPAVFDFNSLNNSQSVDSSEAREGISQVKAIPGEQDSADLSPQVADRSVGDAEALPSQASELTEFPDIDKVDISALLAGGRRDSLNTFGAHGECWSPFYPVVPEAVETEFVAIKEESDAPAEEEGLGGPQISEALMLKCADKLVADILESVSLSVTSKSPDDLQPGSAVPHTSDSPEGISRVPTERGEGEDHGGGGEVARHAGGTGGEELRIGNIVYLPVEENTDGEITVRSTSDVFNASDGADDPDLTRPSSGTKPKPAPLTNLGTDETDSSLPSAGDIPRTHSASGSFSPLRSSAQHLSNFVNYATGFFRNSNEDRANVKDIHDSSAKSTAVETESTRKKHRSASSERGKRSGSQSECRVKNAVKAEERPELFRQVSDLIPQQEDVHSQPAIYLHLRVDEIECDRRVTTSAPCEAYRHQTTKPHYWFSIPRNKADHLYAFFVQWRPDIYGDDDIYAEDRGFVVVENVNLEDQAGSLPIVDDYFGQFGADFRKDWEIISREEARRRGSLAVDPDQSIMPELSQDSSILTDQHIMMLSESLPPRTIGYKWSLVYSTSLHGFSLKRLYREVGHIDSPILLVLRDAEDTVFGAFLSDPPKLSDHFFGNGLCQLWTFKDKFRSFNWTGENAFFIKGDEISMSVGASQGVYGLWLDGDLYHGRSRQCTTFNNIVLSTKEDFCISALEAWAFISD